MTDAAFFLLLYKDVANTHALQQLGIWNPSY